MGNSALYLNIGNLSVTLIISNINVYFFNVFKFSKLMSQFKINYFFAYHKIVVKAVSLTD